METAIDDLLQKVRLIAETPKGDLLRQLVDLLYERLEEEYDTEPLTAEDLEAIRRGQEDIAAGKIITLAEHERKREQKIIEIMLELRKSPKFDPAQDISNLIPRSFGIYGWFNKHNDSIEYVGKATGKNGLYQRIINQHLNKSYLLTDKTKWHDELDAFQIKNYAISNGKPAIDKSAFRKNISRLNKLTPGIESVRFIKNNFHLRFIIINDKDEAKKLEKQLRDKLRKELIYNIM